MTDPRVASFRAALDARPMSAYQWRLVGLLVLLVMTDGYDAQAIGYVAPALVRAWHVDRSSFGPVFSASLAGLTVGAAALTPIADRYGTRLMLMVSTGFYALLTLAAVWAHDVRTLLALRFLAGVGLGATMPNAVALLSEYAPTRMRTTLVSLAVCGFSIGGALGGLVALVAVERWGWQSVFLVGGAVPLLLLPVLAFALPESLMRLLDDPRRRGLARVVARVAPGWSAGPAPAEVPASRPAPVRELFGPGYALPTLLIWTAYAANLILLYTLSNWLPLIITAAGLRADTATLATTAYQAAGTVGAIVLALLCDRLRPTWVVASAFAGAAASVFLISIAGSAPAPMVAGAAAAGFCVVGGQNAANAFVGTFYPVTARATGLGWALAVGRIASVSGPLLAGILLGFGMPPAALFRVCMIPALVAAVSVALIRLSPANWPGRVGRARQTAV